MLAISSIFFFALPGGAGPVSKIVWATVAYIAWDAAYTICDVPMFILPTSMTDNIKERGQLLAMGRYFAMIGITGASMLLPMVQKRLGWLACGIIFSAVAAVTMLPLCFKGKERRVMRPEKEVSLVQMARYVVGNKYLLLFYVAVSYTHLPGAWQDAHSPYRSWYDFSPRYACGYRSWWGFETLPEVNEHDPSYRQFICGEGGVIDYWMDLGASGFRLDVADELPDDFIAELRRAVKRHGEDKYLLGEVWEDATNKWSYGVRRTYLLGKGLDAVMNYPFKEAVLRFVKGGAAQELAEAVTRICENYPGPALDVLMNFVSTHDTVRAITAIAGEPCEGRDRYWQSGQRLSREQYEQGRRKLVLAYALIFTLPGLPSVYYGDEIGMQGYKDPFNRAFFDWHSKENRIRPALQKLAALRKSSSAFADGRFIPVRCEDGVLQFLRAGGRETAEVCVNRNAHDVTATLMGEELTVPAYDFAVRVSKNATKNAGIAIDTARQKA